MVKIIPNKALKFRSYKRKMYVYLFFWDMSPKGPSRRLSFLFDTGCSGVMMRREDFDRLGYGNHVVKCLDPITVRIAGNSLECYRYRVPSIRLAADIVINTPIIRVPITRGTLKRNILGQSVLRRHNYYIDNVSKFIYFKDVMVDSNTRKPLISEYESCVFSSELFKFYVATKMVHDKQSWGDIVSVTSLDETEYKILRDKYHIRP